MTIKVQVPGRDDLVIENVVLDVNGTIALDGKLLAGVADRIARLRELVRIVIVTADTHGGAVRLGEALGLEVVVLDAGDGGARKLESLLRLGPDTTAAIGNGSNDALMLERTALGTCVIGKEGASTKALLKSDIVVTDICDAFDLLLSPRRITATLRT